MNRRATLNRNLGIAALALLVLSAFSYYQSVQRAERFERGQKFLPNLNPDAIQEIVIKKGEEETRLERTSDGDRFLIPSENGYRADNASVNRFIKDVLALSLEKEVGSGEKLEAELELVAGTENPETLEVAFLGSADKEMVRFVVGKSFDDGAGSYVLRADEAERTIYLTDKRVYLSTDGSDFLDKQILDVAQTEVDTIVGDGFTLTREGLLNPPESPSEAAEAAEGEGDTEPATVDRGDLVLVDLPEGKKASSKVSQLAGLLSGLRFTEHHLADAPEVAGLQFTDRVDMELQDGSIYVVEVAQQDDKHFLRIQGFHQAAEQGGVSIARDASDEEMQKTSEVLEAIDNLQTFNAFHGSWIYEVTDFVADKVRLKRSDLVEDA